MMPELGKYAVSVLSAYGVTAVILGVLVVCNGVICGKSIIAMDSFETFRKSDT